MLLSRLQGALLRLAWTVMEGGEGSESTEVVARPVETFTHRLFRLRILEVEARRPPVDSERHIALVYSFI